MSYTHATYLHALKSALTELATADELAQISGSIQEQAMLTTAIECTADALQRARQRIGYNAMFPNGEVERASDTVEEM